MKKILVIVMLCTLVLVGCSSDKKSDSSNSSSSNASKATHTQKEDEALLLSIFSEEHFPSKYYDGSARATTDDDDKDAYEECKGNESEKIAPVASVEGRYTIGSGTDSEVAQLVELRSWDTEQDAKDSFDRAQSRLESCYGQELESDGTTSVFEAAEIEPSFDTVDEYVKTDVTMKTEDRNLVGHMYITRVGRFAISMFILGDESQPIVVSTTAVGAAHDIDSIAEDLLTNSKSS